MPITRSAIKKLKQDKQQEIVNKKAKRNAKEAIKKFKSAPSDKLLASVFSTLDQTKKKKIYHGNKVARLKSRLSRLIKAKKAPQKV